MDYLVKWWYFQHSKAHSRFEGEYHIQTFSELSEDDSHVAYANWAFFARSVVKYLAFSLTEVVMKHILKYTDSYFL